MNTIEELSKTTGKFLVEHKLKISVAESCTGGLLGASLTDIAGSSAYFRGGVIAYDNQIKHQLLGVEEQILDRYGAVSDQTVIAMAKGACKLFNTECAISVSGIAGPDGGTAQKPVGLVYIGIAVGDRLESIRCVFSGNRQQIRSQAVKASLEQFLRIAGQLE
ncbi:MAG: CinA family protein [Fibrobacter sp.]|jgi:PncC family amidohydrolase|nr:CinA family protein [Fibrobacter sp.]